MTSTVLTCLFSFLFLFSLHLFSSWMKKNLHFRVVCQHGLSKLNENVLNWNMMFQGSAIKRQIFDVIGTSSSSSANLCVCSCWDACSLSLCVQGQLLAALLSDWNCLGSRQQTPVVFTQGQDLIMSLPVALSPCGADRNRQGQKTMWAKYQSNRHVLKCSFYFSTYFDAVEACAAKHQRKKDMSVNLVLHNKMKVIAIWQLTSPSFYLHVFTYYPNPPRSKSLHLGD